MERNQSNIPEDDSDSEPEEETEVRQNTMIATRKESTREQATNKRTTRTNKEQEQEQENNRHRLNDKKLSRRQTEPGTKSTQEQRQNKNIRINYNTDTDEESSDMAPYKISAVGRARRAAQHQWRKRDNKLTMRNASPPESTRDTLESNNSVPTQHGRNVRQKTNKGQSKKHERTSDKQQRRR